MMPILLNDTSVICINHAAITYHVPAQIILSVMKKEGGKNGDAHRNKNGTVDYGVMQINSIFLPKIAKYGYTKNDLQYDACKNVMVGTWLIATHLAEGKTFWTSVANYHSHTTKYNKAYQKSVYANYQKLNQLLS